MSLLKFPRFAHIHDDEANFIAPLQHSVQLVRLHITDIAGCERQTHLFPEISCHLLACSPTAYYLEHMPWAQPLLAEKLEMVDGRIRLPERPGLGLVWDEDAVARWKIDSA